jgi:ribokinase
LPEGGELAWLRMPSEIVAIGDINIDLTIPVEAPPAPGEEAYVDEAATALGGSALNTSRVLARLGLGVGMLAAVGGDEWGRRATDELVAARVATDRIQVVDGNTGLNLIMVSPGGERTMVAVRGANRRLQLPPDWSSGCRWLHVSAYALLQDPQRQACLGALATAHRHGIPVSADIPSGVARDLGPKLIDDLGPVRCLSAGKRSIEVVTGGAGPASLLEAGIGLVAVTAGASPVELVSAGESVAVRPPRVEAMDTSGAGDWFVAGLIAATYRGLELGPSALVATALGAAATLAPGTGTDRIDERLSRVLGAEWNEVEADWIEAARPMLSEIVDTEPA